MKICIIGGSQGTGARLAALATAAAHDVVVLSRRGAAPEGATALTGSATDLGPVTQAVTGADAVIVTVGGAKGVHHQRTAVTRTVVEAMRASGVRRLLVQSSLGAGGSAVQLPRAMRGITMLALAKPLADHDEQEATVTASGLDWTIVRPSGLTDKPATGTWTALEVGQPGTLRGTIPRGDLAAFMLELLTDDAAVGKAFGVSSR
ncbi:kynurenine 3-monooxygenase [Flavimobilis soli]|uniref:Kynurenine 3-monooxygenase n=1 Tax=Flavimobilis soli TaxID=442709 RepID=A0A2A9ECA0_9MICO|nr:NAD(P)H-binding protein [Flavimobilis soli]PFG36171.1 kynurenine 3-monooxygenase [Flavimobilis soli]